MSKNHIQISGLCISQGNIWATKKNTNLLLKIDAHNFMLLGVYEIGNNTYVKRAWSDKLFYLNGYLFILYYASKEIYVFDTDTCEVIEVISLPDGQYVYQESIELVEDKIILFPSWKMPMAIISVKDGKIHVEYDKCPDDWYLSRGCCVTDDVALFVDRWKNKLYTYRINTGEIEESLVGKNETVYWGVSKVDSKLVLPHLKEKLITVLDSEEKKYSEISDFPKGYILDGEGAYYETAVYGKYVYLFARRSNMIIRVNTESNTVECVYENFFELRDKKRRNSYEVMFENFLQQGSRVYYYDYASNHWFVFDLERCGCEVFAFLVGDEFEKQLRAAMEPIVKESEDVGLDDLILFVTDKNYFYKRELCWIELFI